MLKRADLGLASLAADHSIRSALASGERVVPFREAAAVNADCSVQLKMRHKCGADLRCPKYVKQPGASRRA
jgi:hypothetical protein